MPLTNKLARTIALNSRFPHHSGFPDPQAIFPKLFRDLSYEAYARWEIGVDDFVRIHHFMPASIALHLRQVFDRRWSIVSNGKPGARPAQYGVLRLASPYALVVSFNWDGLAPALCVQRVVAVHGTYLKGMPLSDGSLMRALAWTQLYDVSDGKDILGPDVVLPGEESSNKTAAVREQVFKAVRQATTVVAIGYSFGLWGDYDSVWRELLVEAMCDNPAQFTSSTYRRNTSRERFKRNYAERRTCFPGQ